MGTLIGILIGILALGLILYIVGITAYSIGNIGFFAGGKHKFSGVATTKYKSNLIEIKETRNLNGSTLKTLKVNKMREYNILCDIQSIKGNGNVKIKDGSGNVVVDTNESIIGGKAFSSEKGGRLFVYMEFEKFNGDVAIRLIDKA